MKTFEIYTGGVKAPAGEVIVPPGRARWSVALSRRICGLKTFLPERVDVPEPARAKNHALAGTLFSVGTRESNDHHDTFTSNVDRIYRSLMRVRFDEL